MAKHCNVCKQFYSDTLNRCPRCGRAAEGTDAATTVQVMEDDLHLADTPRAASESYADVDLDRSADAGQAQPSAWGPGEGISAVNLGGALSAILPSPSGEMPPPSGLGLVSEALDEEFSGVLVRGTSDDPENARVIPTGLEQTPPPLPKPSDADFAPDDEEAARLESSSVDLGGPAPTGERPSGRDLIAEEVESGAGLRKEQDVAETEEILVDQSRSVILSDSAVDLGAPGPIVDSPSNPFVAGANQTPTDLHLRQLVAGSAEQGALPVAADAMPAATPPTSVEPSTVPRAPSAKPWLVGGTIGALASAALFLALWSFGIEPPSALRVARPAVSPAEQITEKPSPGPVVSLPAVGEGFAEVNKDDSNRAEVKAYWQLRDLLQDGGYSVGPTQTAVAALEAALRDANERANVEALQKKQDQLTKDLNAERKKNADLAENTKQEEKKARDEIAKARDHATKTLKDLNDKVKAAEATAKAAEAKLIEAGARLEAAGIKTTDVANGIEGLAAARADAETKLAAAERHPALNRPDSLPTANFLAAEQHYTAGLRLYSDQRYADAEKEFLAAAQSESQDARYFYYLGLSRLLLKKRDAALADFEQAAKLEQQGRPDRATVSEALERVQGPRRQDINRFRP